MNLISNKNLEECFIKLENEAIKGNNVNCNFDIFYNLCKKFVDEVDKCENEAKEEKLLEVEDLSDLDNI